MARDRKNPYAPSSTDGKDGSYVRPPGKFALTDALGSSGRSAVAPRPIAPSPVADDPDDETPEDDAGHETATKEAEQEAPPAPIAPAQKLPRLDLGRRGGKP